MLAADGDGEEARRGGARNQYDGRQGQERSIKAKGLGRVVDPHARSKVHICDATWPCPEARAPCWGCSSLASSTVQLAPGCCGLTTWLCQVYENDAADLHALMAVVFETMGRWEHNKRLQYGAGINVEL